MAQTQQRINQANAELDKLVGVRTRSIQRKLSGISRLDKEIAQEMLKSDDDVLIEEEKQEKL